MPIRSGQQRLADDRLGLGDWTRSFGTNRGLRAAGFGDIGIEAFEAGLSAVEWPGRLQRLRHGRLPGLVPQGSELWLDGGHNIDGGRILAAAMADLQERGDAPLVLVAALLGTKDAEGFLANFSGLARFLVAVPLPGQVAARPAEEVAAMQERALWLAENGRLPVDPSGRRYPWPLI